MVAGGREDRACRRALGMSGGFCFRFWNLPLSAGVQLHLKEQGWLRWEEAQLLAGEGLGRPQSKEHEVRL